jgi:hypothetical protein
MPVITSDILIKGVKREAVFDWLGAPANHERILGGAFDSVKTLDQGVFQLTQAASGRSREYVYEIRTRDNEHGGRRVLVALSSKRMTGKLHFSLSTAKGSADTLVTLHLDYDAGSRLGGLLDAIGARRRMEATWIEVLQNLKRALEAG